MKKKKEKYERLLTLIFCDIGIKVSQWLTHFYKEIYAWEYGVKQRNRSTTPRAPCRSKWPKMIGDVAFSSYDH